MRPSGTRSMPHVPPAYPEKAAADDGPDHDDAVSESTPAPIIHLGVFAHPRRSFRGRLPGAGIALVPEAPGPRPGPSDPPAPRFPERPCRERPPSASPHRRPYARQVPFRVPGRALGRIGRLEEPPPGDGTISRALPSRLRGLSPAPVEAPPAEQAPGPPVTPASLPMPPCRGCARPGRGRSREHSRGWRRSASGGAARRHKRPRRARPRRA